MKDASVPLRTVTKNQGQETSNWDKIQFVSVIWTKKLTSNKKESHFPLSVLGIFLLLASLY